MRALYTGLYIYIYIPLKALDRTLIPSFLPKNQPVLGVRAPIVLRFEARLKGFNERGFRLGFTV